MTALRHSPRSMFCAMMILIAANVAVATAQELPKKDPNGGERFDFEPKLMLNDIPDSPLPASDPGSATPTALPPMDVVKLESDLEKARKTAAWRERLYKSGVLSKVEAEQGAIRIVRLTRDLEAARLQAATRTAEERRKAFESGDTPKAALDEAEAAVAAATTATQAAAAKWDETQRGAAELRLQRERKLLAVGAGSRASVKRAEAALQVLATGQK